MKNTDRIYQAYLEILREELRKAMGCTEPIALAYAAAKARETLGEDVKRVEIGASGSIIKNVKSVFVPNTGHLKGIEAAVAAGIVAGDASKELEVLSCVTEEQIDEMKHYLEVTPMSLEHVDHGLTFEIIVKVFSEKDEHYALVRIVNYHTNIVLIEKDGEKILEHEIDGESESNLTDRSLLTMDHIWDFVHTVDIEDLKPILDPQIECNMAIAKEGLEGDYGSSIGKILLSMNDDVKTRARAYAAAGSDARMNGCELPVVINSGSGNQGITASVPVIIYSEELGKSEEERYRALALSNLTTIHQKTSIGRLSAYCGAVSAAAGAGAGIAYLCGGSFDEVTRTVMNSVAIVSGMVCDGAKASCAAKIAEAIDTAILGFNMAKRGLSFEEGDGIVNDGVEGTIKNVGRLAKNGMEKTNEEIIQIMITK